jgi:lysyl endopeptidase
VASRSVGSWTDEAGQATWSVAVETDQAEFVALKFGALQVPTGTTLRVIDEDGYVRHSLEADELVTAIGASGTLDVPPVAGTRALIQLQLPPGDRPDATIIEVAVVTYGIEDIAGLVAPDRLASADGFRAFGPSCNVDLACANYWPWNVVGKGNVYLTVNSTTFSGGSGSLINNTANNCKPYVLTAKHVRDQILNPTFWFNYQEPSCGSSTRQGLGLRVGLDLQRLVGGTLVQLARTHHRPAMGWV